MTISDDPELVRLLKRLGEVEPGPEETSRAVERTRQALLAQTVLPRSRRRRLLGLAASILLVAALLGLAGWLMFSEGTALAFADVQEKLQKTKTVTFKVTRENQGRPADSERCLIKAPDLLRVETAGGVSITDYGRRKSLLLNPGKKEARLIQGLGLPAPNIYEMLRTIPNDTVKRLADKKIAGKKALGFLVRLGEGRYRQEATVWVDPETRLPVRLEIAGKDDQGREARQVLDEIMFDRPLDAALFSLTPPAGYKTQTLGLAELPPPPSDKERLAPVVTPKVGIGPARFGMKKDEVIRVLGKPDDIPAEGKGMALNYFSRGFSLLVSPKRGLMMINCVSQKTFITKVNDFQGKTKEGIGLGASAKDVERAYGKPSRRENNGPGTLYLKYDQLGLHFTLFDERVVQITASAN